MPLLHNTSGLINPANIPNKPYQKWAREWKEISEIARLKVPTMTGPTSPNTCTNVVYLVKYKFQYMEELQLEEQQCKYYEKCNKGVVPVSNNREKVSFGGNQDIGN